MMDMTNFNPIQIQKYLGGMEYPASKQELIEHAKEQGAPEEVVRALDEAPTEEYETPADLIHGISENT
jgi:hypothetical protein